jgi:hypothetical protein
VHDLADETTLHRTMVDRATLWETMADRTALDGTMLDRAALGGTMLDGMTFGRTTVDGTALGGMSFGGTTTGRHARWKELQSAWHQPRQRVRQSRRGRRPVGLGGRRRRRTRELAVHPRRRHDRLGRGHAVDGAGDAGARSLVARMRSRRSGRYLRRRARALAAWCTRRHMGRRRRCGLVADDPQERRRGFLLRLDEWEDIEKHRGVRRSRHAQTLLRALVFMRLKMALRA